MMLRGHLLLTPPKMRYRVSNAQMRTHATAMAVWTKSMIILADIYASYDTLVCNQTPSRTLRNTKVRVTTRTLPLYRFNPCGEVIATWKGREIFAARWELSPNVTAYPRYRHVNKLLFGLTFWQRTVNILSRFAARFAHDS